MSTDHKIQHLINHLTSTPPEDLHLHLSALLEARSTNKRMQKIQRKESDQKAVKQTRFVAKVLYQTNNRLVTQFLSVPANQFLLSVFKEQNGLELELEGKP